MSVKVTYPHMGTLNIVLNALLRELDLEVIEPPPISKRTLEFGTVNSPEFACLPLKITLGNFLEALELGAETIIMAGGCGPCRFGYYAQVQREILTDLGCKFQMLVLEAPQNGWIQLLTRIRELLGGFPVRKIQRGWLLGMEKARAIDQVEAEVEKTRPIANQTTVDRIYQNFLTELETASLLKDVQNLVAQFSSDLIDLRQGRRSKIRIGVVGEIYTVLEPSANLDILEKLGALGVEVVRDLRLSHWIDEHLTLNAKKKAHLRGELEQLATPYLQYFVGGHGLESVAHSIRYCRDGLVSGIIQVAPLTCMPEIVAQTVLPNVSRDFGKPILTIYLDEQTSEAGLQTRLEAFVDLLPPVDITISS